MEVHSCSLNLQHSGCSGFVEIGVLHEKSSRSRQRGGWNLDGEVDDAEAGGLLGDYGDVAGAGDGVGHAGVEAAGGEKANVRDGNSGGGPLQGHRISGERAGIVGGEEGAEGGDVQVDIGVGEGNAGG